MERRTFLKLSGMATASSLLSGCQKGNEKLIPFLIAPEDGSIPGVADYYASTCRQCPAGCGIVVKVSEGRAKKIEGNPEHPVNRGKLCARGQAALQELYHPDRIRQPLKRTGKRGTGQFAPITWNEALDTLQTRLIEVHNQGEANRVAFLTEPLTGSFAVLLRRFMDSFGSSRILAWDFNDYEWLKLSCQEIFGTKSIPDYDIENSQYVLSFGADFIESHLSPVRYASGFGSMRQTRPTVRGRFTYVGARLSLTAASADRWMPARPGTEGVVALGLAGELVRTGRYSEEALRDYGIDTSELKSILLQYPLENVARTSGLDLAPLRATARDLATIAPAMAIAGESVAWQSNGVDSSKAILLLNLLLGTAGNPGGIQPSPGFSATIRGGYGEMLDFIDEAKAGNIRLAMIHRCNPAYSVPAALGFRDALEQVPFTVSFSGFLDETSQMADLILPIHSDLETWGEVSPDRGVRQPVTGLMQPVVKPLHDSRSAADILIALGSSLAPSTGGTIPWKSGIQLLQETALGRSTPAAGERSAEWNKILQRGFVTGRPATSASTGTVRAQVPELEPAQYSGDPKTYPFHLQPYLSINFHDGRNAHLPWLQQLPDPMTTAVWDSWVEINPATAEKLGIAHGDLVEVGSEQGKLTLPAVIYPGLHPEVLAIPIGQGHQGFGRYADKTGKNPLQILVPVRDSRHGLPAWGATRVAIRKVSGKGDLVTAGHREGSYRRDILGI